MEVEWDYTNENGYYNLCFEYAGAGTEFRITAYLPNGPSHYYHTYSGSGDIWHNFTYHPSSGGD
jgi:hypothetical protein